MLALVTLSGCSPSRPIARLAASAAPASPTAPEALGAVATGSDPVVAGNPLGYLVFGEVPEHAIPNDRWVRSLSVTGQPTGPARPSGTGKAAVAVSGRSLLLAESSGSLDLRLLDRDGTPQGPPRSLPDTELATLPAMAWDGHEFLAAYGLPGSNNVFALIRDFLVGQRVAADGTPVGDRLTLVPASQITRFALAGGRRRFLLVWRADLGDEGGPTVLLDQLLDEAGTPAAPRHAISGKSLFQEHPEVAVDPQGYLAVWRSTTASGMTQILAQALDRAGTPRGAVHLLSVAANCGMPAVASSARGYLVVWPEQDATGTRLAGANFTLAGMPTTSMTIAATYPGLAAVPSLASDGEHFLAVWNGDGQATAVWVP